MKQEWHYTDGNLRAKITISGTKGSRSLFLGLYSFNGETLCNYSLSESRKFYFKDFSSGDRFEGTIRSTFEEAVSEILMDPVNVQVLEL